MALRVYNSLTDQKEIFEPVNPPNVGIYLCGPTVYKSPHIGHMVGPVIFDAIKRYLTFKGFHVTWIVNITDVEDKLIDASAKTGLSVKDLAEKYSAEYLGCLRDLGVSGIDRFPKASEHIPEIISMCQSLIDKGFAYAADGNVYFDITRDKDYGKLSNRKVEEQESGTRAVEGSGKRNPADFALWKSAKPGEPKWDSPWGPGRPGWHIECSAMSMKYLGETFDIHGGGLDLLFPHHENELAQSENATGKVFVKYWLHNGLTRLDTKKMSGSIGNVVAARKLIDEHGPVVLRYLLLSTHYRSPIEFGESVLDDASKAIVSFRRVFEDRSRVRGKAAELREDLRKSIDDLEQKFFAAMDDDFNTAAALGTLHVMANNTRVFQLHGHEYAENMAAVVAYADRIEKLLRLLGFSDALFGRAGADDQFVDQLMQLFILLRAEARAGKNFALADAIRKHLTEIGVTLEDRPDGTIWRRA